MTAHSGRWRSHRSGLILSGLAAAGWVLVFSLILLLGKERASVGRLQGERARLVDQLDASGASLLEAQAKASAASQELDRLLREREDTERALKAVQINLSEHRQARFRAEELARREREQRHLFQEIALREQEQRRLLEQAPRAEAQASFAMTDREGGKVASDAAPKPPPSASVPAGDQGSSPAPGSGSGETRVAAQDGSGPGSEAARRDREEARSQLADAQRERENARALMAGVRREQEAARRLSQEAARDRDEARRLVQEAARDREEARRLADEAQRDRNEARRVAQATRTAGDELDRLEGEIRELRERRAALVGVSRDLQRRITSARATLAALEQGTAARARRQADMDRPLHPRPGRREAGGYTVEVVRVPRQ